MFWADWGWSNYHLIRLIFGGDPNPEFPDLDHDLDPGTSWFLMIVLDECDVVQGSLVVILICICIYGSWIQITNHISEFVKVFAFNMPI